MKYLLVTHFFPPGHTAGTENYTFGLAKILLDRGNEVEVVCAEDWTSGESYWNGVTHDEFEGVPVHRIHLNWEKAGDPNKILYDSYPVEEWFDQFLSRENFDLVHVTSLVTLGVGVLRSVKRTGIPLVLTLTDFWFICPTIQLVRSDGGLCEGNRNGWNGECCLTGRSNIIRRLNRFLPEPVRPHVWDKLSQFPWLTRQRGFRGLLLNLADRQRVLEEAIQLPDRIIAPSYFLKQMFEKWFPVRIEAIPHGHDLAWLDHYPGKTASSKIRFGYLGQIQNTKGVHILIQAFLAANLGDRACLSVWGDISGDDEYAQSLKSLVGDHPSIEIKGRYLHEELYRVLAGIDVLAVPSLWYENAPLVIQEAFATRTPVIATNLGGMAEAVTHEINGLLFERGDIEGLAAQMRRVVEEPGLLERLPSGIPPVQTTAEEAAELEEIYRELTGDRELVFHPGGVGVFTH